MSKGLKKCMSFLLSTLMITSMVMGFGANTAKAAITDGLVLDYTVNQTFDGTSQYIDKTSDVGLVSGLSQGSIAVRFKSTSTAVAKTFLSASHTNDPSSNISFTLNNGTVYFENRENGTYAARMSASGTYNDGNWHTAILTVGSTGTKIYVDGTQEATSTSVKFFPNVTSINGMWIGKNVDNGGGQWYYNGEIVFVKVYNRVLTSTDISELSSLQPGQTPFFTEQLLFDTSDGRGYAQYRIPSISVTANGTVLVVAEARTGDDQTPTDLVLRRSTDGGATFSNQVILAPGASQGYAEMNPMLLAENTGNTVHLLWSRWSWGNCRYFTMDSYDNGATWNTARDITSVLDTYKNSSSPNYFAGLSGAGMGPGHGIQLTNGTLVVPIYITTSNWTSSSVAIISSTDGGATWTGGPWVPNPSGFTRIHENMMVQLSNGQILANMRNPGSSYRAISKTSGVNSSWLTPYSDTALIDPVCAASIHKYDANTIVFTNCASTSSRTNLKIKMSYDNSSTWPVAKLIYSGTSGYSDVFVGPDKTIFCFYEKPATTKICLARFNKEWVVAP